MPGERKDWEYFQQPPQLGDGEMSHGEMGNQEMGDQEMGDWGMGDWEMGDWVMGDWRQHPSNQQQDGAHKHLETHPACSITGESAQGTARAVICSACFALASIYSSGSPENLFKKSQRLLPSD